MRTYIKCPAEGDTITTGVGDAVVIDVSDHGLSLLVQTTSHGQLRLTRADTGWWVHDSRELW